MTCDRCHAALELAPGETPWGWGKVRVETPETFYEYHLCPMCRERHGQFIHAVKWGNEPQPPQA